MAIKEWTDEEVAYLRDAVARGMSDAAIAEHLRRSHKSVENKRRALGIAGGQVVLRGRAQAAMEPPPPKPFDIAELPDELPTADELLERRRRQFARRAAAKEARKLIPVTVHLDGPIGIAHFGDPHIDDDGTDIVALERHVAVVNRTEGLFAGNVGDTTNNWVGRLAALHAKQTTTAAEAWVLAEWMIRSMDWLYIVAGNHDCWSGAGDPLRWIAGQQGSLYEPHGVRLGLHFPNGRVIRVNARHDFPGHSQWNTAHGPAKAAQMGIRDHVLTCGHKHISGYQVVKDPSSGLITHALRVASYKVYDDYAESKSLLDQRIFTCPVTIIDPAFPDDDPRCVHVILDPEEAAEYLTWKRSRWKAGKKAA